MKIYKEKEDRLKDETRKKLIESIATSEYGQAIREELVDKILEISDIKKIPREVIDGETPKLSIEIIGRGIASAYMEDLYKMLTPKKDKVGFITKTHK